MSVKRDKGIIAYGTELDRQKLAVLAGLSGRTGSDWIVNKIREEYEAAFGSADPNCIGLHH